MKIYSTVSNRTPALHCEACVIPYVHHQGSVFNIITLSSSSPQQKHYDGYELCNIFKSLIVTVLTNIEVINSENLSYFKVLLSH